MRNQKGITLIALVITIIVLLILAGVSIAMLSGENGILNKASEAKEASATGTLDEACKIAVGNIISENLSWPTVTADTFKAEVATVNNSLTNIDVKESESHTGYWEVTADGTTEGTVVYVKISSGAVYGSEAQLPTTSTETDEGATD